MGIPLSRTCRVYNRGPDEIELLVVENPGNFGREKITIPFGESRLVSYNLVDKTYNTGRNMLINILHQDQIFVGVIAPFQIRDDRILELTFDPKTKGWKALKPSQPSIQEASMAQAPQNDAALLCLGMIDCVFKNGSNMKKK